MVRIDWDEKGGDVFQQEAWHAFNQTQIAIADFHANVPDALQRYQYWSLEFERLHAQCRR